MNALMFMGEQNKMPLQVILRNIVLSNQASSVLSSGAGYDLKDRNLQNS